MIILIGPKNSPITGQSLAFSVLVDSLDVDSKVIFYPVFFRSKLVLAFSTLFFLIRCLAIFLKNSSRVSTVYITTSRTHFGFLRDFVVVYLSKALGFKVVNHLHGSDFLEFHKNATPRKRKYIDYLYNLIDTSIVLLPNMKEQYSMYPNMEIKVVSNGCTLPKNVYEFEEKNKLEILYLSNIMYSKGIVHLIEAVAKLNANGKKFKLLVAGKILGDEYLSQQEMSDKFYHLLDNYGFIEYLGVVKGDNKENLYNRSMFFALPTFYKTEAQPLSIIESMMHGNVVISTVHKYMPDFLSEKNGALVDVMNEDQIASSIASLVEDNDRLHKIYEHNLEYSNSNFSSKTYVEEIAKVLR
ncbi:glycosyltransferase family 4 protein [Salinivibrio proteolyticus]|uniref:Glycosyltransferase family 4 protein n=1 Tax=Salinivibrio proteolyticus TaxID=334715 RepID=A0ABY7L9M2_9GAMM|nr:glycosyltransferase family 4 protein [Salinivibrio proteolyticus]WBA13952.1 glycosyltransferase family 4 protein [Salinivibrio proteolyticus]